jgi:hypothetical protein
MNQQQRAVVQQALEALEDVDGIDTETECVTIDVGEAITALRQLLEQPEPVDEPSGFDDQMIVSILRTWCETDHASQVDSEWCKGYQAACQFVKKIVGERHETRR